MKNGYPPISSYKHYCGSLTFREQRNRIENLKQGSREDAVDFLIRVGSAIEGLSKEWSKSITPAELDTLQYDVSLNGVSPNIRHVLNSEIAAHGRLTPERMYEAVKRYETYMARSKRLESSSPFTGQQRWLPIGSPRLTPLWPLWRKTRNLRPVRVMRYLRGRC